VPGVPEENEPQSPGRSRPQPPAQVTVLSTLWAAGRFLLFIVTAPARRRSTEENKQRLSDRTVFILLVISVVALSLWWTRHLWLSWVGLSRG
jgi:hypothetical protein